MRKPPVSVPTQMNRAPNLCGFSLSDPRAALLTIVDIQRGFETMAFGWSIHVILDTETPMSYSPWPAPSPPRCCLSRRACWSAGPSAGLMDVDCYCDKTLLAETAKSILDLVAELSGAETPGADRIAQGFDRPVPRASKRLRISRVECSEAVGGGGRAG